VRFTVVDGSVSDVDAVGCEMASGGVTVLVWPLHSLHHIVPRPPLFAELWT
jgi:hypothetical protein